LLVVINNAQPRGREQLGKEKNETITTFVYRRLLCGIARYNRQLYKANRLKQRTKSKHRLVKSGTLCASMPHSQLSTAAPKYVLGY
jgi:hypothetical protein